MGVQFFVAEPHHEGFVADQSVWGRGKLLEGLGREVVFFWGFRDCLRLVVALGIGNGLLAVAAVG